MRSAHSAEDTDLYRRAEGGDIKARNMLAERHMGLVKKTAEFYARRNPHIALDDLIQEGRLGIIIALGKFKVDKGFKFSTYATWWIKHHIGKYVTENHSRAASSSKKDTEMYFAERMPEQDARLYEARCISYVGLHATSEKRWDHLEEFLDSGEVPIEEVVEASLDWQQIIGAIVGDILSEREQVALCMRYGVLGHRQHNLSEIASEIGITKQAVSSIVKNSVKKLQRHLEGEDG